MTKAPMTQPTEAHADIVKQAERNAGWRDERFQCITDPALLLDLAAEITRLRTELAEAHTRGVKAGLEAWNHWYDRATADDDCEYLNGEGWGDAAKLRAIDPASAALDPEASHA